MKHYMCGYVFGKVDKEVFREIPQCMDHSPPGNIMQRPMSIHEAVNVYHCVFVVCFFTDAND